MKSEISNLAIIVGLALGYYGAALLGHSLTMGLPQAVPVWPPTGLALGAVLLLGPRVWPAVLLGAFLGHAASPEMAGVAPWQAILASIGAALGSTASVLAGAALANRFTGGAGLLGHPNDFFKFVLLAGVLCTTLSPAIGVLGHFAAGLHSAWGSARLWLHWWLGELVSAIAVTPLVLAWCTRVWCTPRRRATEPALMLLLLLGLAVLIFFTPAASQNAAELDFLVIPLVLWAALRLGHRIATASVCLLGCVATLGTLNGVGPFTDDAGAGPLLVLQAFIGVMAMMTGMVVAGVWQRRQAESALVRSEEAYRQLFESNPQPVCVCECLTGGVLAANRAAQQVYGYSFEQFLQLHWHDLQVAPLSGPAGHPRPPIPEGAAVHQRHRRRDGAEIEVEVVAHTFSFKGRSALVLVCTDVTQRKQAEKQALVFTNLGERLSLARNQQEAARTIVDAASTLFGWDAAIFHTVRPGSGDLSVVLGLEIVQGQPRSSEPVLGKSDTFARKVLHVGAQLVRRRSEDMSATTIPFAGSCRPSESVMGVPIRRDDNTIGLLIIHSYLQNAYTEADLRLLQALADHCGGALDRIRAEEEINRLNRELRHHLEELQALFDVAPVGIAVAADPSFEYLSVNEACKTLFGLSRPEDLKAIAFNNPGAPASLRLRGQPLSADQFPMCRVLELGLPRQEMEVDIHLADGRLIHCYACATPLFGDNGEIRGSVGIFVDLTARKNAEDEILRLNSELERRVRERTLQLEATNKELEAFSYSVSHDLRAPLRSIRGFSEVLVERYQGLLDERGREFLRRVCDSCAHMDRLIEDLLKLSRVGRAELQHREVSLSRLAESIFADLRKADPGRDVKVEVTPGLVARGDERLLRVALDNLIRNSWKFTLKTPRPEIEFGFSTAGRPAFFVRDNGAGFDPAYASRLFSVFQRLHSAGEFPGTGVGLATVQRIIRRHGGETWATGAVNRGACFYFTLPETGVPSAASQAPAGVPEHLPQ